MQEIVDLKNSVDDKKLKDIANRIKNGDIVIFPTETVYGIGTNGLNEKSVKKIYDIKKRPLNKPITLLVSDFKMINDLAKNITDIEYKLMERFFPGPFTIILDKKDIVPNVVTSNGETVGIRMPDSVIAKKLVEYAGVPIATPSANITGKPSGTKLADVIEDFYGKVDYIIDGGESKLGISSTIVRVKNGKPVILREGSITKEQIEECINNK